MEEKRNNSTQVVGQSNEKKSGNAATIAAVVGGSVVAGAGAGYAVNEFINEDDAHVVTATTEEQENNEDQLAANTQTTQPTGQNTINVNVTSGATETVTSEIVETETTNSTEENNEGYTDNNSSSDVNEGNTDVVSNISEEEPVVYTPEDGEIIIAEPIDPDPVNPDDIADAIISGEEVDPNDIDMADVVEFHSIEEVYDENGESYIQAQFTDHYGNEYAMIDVDGDSVFDYVTTSDGSEIVGYEEDYTIADAELDINDDNTYVAQTEYDNEIPETDFADDIILV